MVHYWNRLVQLSWYKSTFIHECKAYLYNVQYIFSLFIFIKWVFLFRQFSSAVEWIFALKINVELTLGLHEVKTFIAKKVKMYWKNFNKIEQICLDFHLIAFKCWVRYYFTTLFLQRDTSVKYLLYTSICLRDVFFTQKEQEPGILDIKSFSGFTSSKIIIIIIFAM